MGLEDERRLRGQREDGQMVVGAEPRPMMCSWDLSELFQTLDSCRQLLFMEKKMNPEWISFLSTGAARITVTGRWQRELR